MAMQSGIYAAVRIGFCWLVLVSAGIPVAWFDTIGEAETLRAPARIYANSNQTAAGTMADGVLTIELEIREGAFPRTPRSTSPYIT